MPWGGAKICQHVNYAGFRKVNSTVPKCSEKIKNTPTFTATENYIQSIQKPRDGYDAKTGIRTIIPM